MVISIEHNRTGDWGPSSLLWTSEIKRKLELNTEQEDSRSFWMSFRDFLIQFQALNICYLQEWQEVRIKGRFIRVQDVDNSNIEVVFSRWYYDILITEQTHLIITLHQEDERIEGTLPYRSYLDVGIVILRNNGTSVELMEVKDFVSRRECEIEVMLDPGDYIVLPRTTGCALKRLAEIKGKEVIELNSVIKDVFRKYDIKMKQELGYTEFKWINECLNQKMTEEEFNKKFVLKYCSKAKGLCFQGFKEFFLESLKELGETITWDWLENLGYNKYLAPIRSRTFVLSFHSDKELSVNVKDAVPTSLDNTTNALILDKSGQEVENKAGVKLLYTFSPYNLPYLL